MLDIVEFLTGQVPLSYQNWLIASSPELIKLINLI